MIGFLTTSSASAVSVLAQLAAMKKDWTQRMTCHEGTNRKILRDMFPDMHDDDVCWQAEKWADIRQNEIDREEEEREMIRARDFTSWERWVNRNAGEEEILPLEAETWQRKTLPRGTRLCNCGCCRRVSRLTRSMISGVPKRGKWQRSRRDHLIAA